MGTNKESPKDLPRPPSVDDLFDPMWRLEMHSHGDEPPTSGGTPRTALAQGAGRGGDERFGAECRGSLSVIDEARQQEESLAGAREDDLPSSSGAPVTADPKSIVQSLAGSLSVRPAAAKPEPGVGFPMGPPASREAKHSKSGGESVLDRREGGMSVLGGPGGYGEGVEAQLLAALKKEPYEVRSPDALDDLPKSNPTSDDEHAVVDERKQKRMLSNRESARRSRLRKQQHLDELRAHVAQLRAENNHMLNKFNIAARHYTQLTEENRMLQHHAVDLSRSLQRLHHAAAAAGPAGLHAMNAISSMAGMGSMSEYGGHMGGTLSGMGGMHHLGLNLPGMGGMRHLASTMGGSLGPGMNGSLGGSLGAGMGAGRGGGGGGMGMQR